jgi:hypothetical protein
VLKNISRATAWIILAAIVLLTMVPPGLRPITLAPHNVEHAAVFLLDGLAFAFAYRGHALLLGCAGAQQLSPPRPHPINSIATVSRSVLPQTVATALRLSQVVGH